MAITQISDVVVPEIFAQYVQQESEVKNRLLSSGIMERNTLIDQLLAGGGLTFNVPGWTDLADDADVTPTDAQADSVAASYQSGTPTDANRGDLVPKKISSATEIAVRVLRSQGWSASNLAAILAGDDPMAAIQSRVAEYWARREQDTLISVVKGVLADNTANDSADFTYDIKGSTYSEGLTTFSAEAFIDAMQTMGDSSEDLAAVAMHSVVYSRARKNNLIDFIPDAEGRINIPTFLGRQVIVDDRLPVSSGVYDTWLFGRGFIQYGTSSPIGTPAVEIERKPLAGKGIGEEILINRRMFCMHPKGFAYSDSGGIPNGGPSNSDFETAANWNRVYSTRKQIKFARLVTRES